MKLRTLVPFFVIVCLSGCAPLVIPPSTPTPQTPVLLPDLVVSSVSLGMQGIPNNSGCVPAYAPFEIRAIIENRGTAPAGNVSVVEQSTQHQVQIGTLSPSQSTEVQFPLSPAGSYTVVIDPQNAVSESDENNNVYSYLAPTPTPPALCTPAQATPAPTFPPLLSTSLEGLNYADISLAKISKVVSGGASIQYMDGLMVQVSPNGLQALFERSGDLWLAEPMDNPGVNVTNTPDRLEQFPQWWAANPAKIVFNSMGIHEAQEKNWNHSISGYVSMMNKDGTDYTVLSDVPSYTRPALSPDSKTIAYDRLGVPMLYEMGMDSRPLDLSQYVPQTGLSGTIFTSPAFSPDGRQLAWWVSDGPIGSQRHFALVMFDLTGKTVTLWHSYFCPADMSGWLDAPVWSPGGQWIAFQTRSENTPYDLWIMNADGTNQRLGLATNPVWSPDGQRLVYVQWPPRTDSNPTTTISVIDVPSWNVRQTGLPAGSIPLAWVLTPQ